MAPLTAFQRTTSFLLFLCFGTRKFTFGNVFLFDTLAITLLLPDVIDGITVDCFVGRLVGVTVGAMVGFKVGITVGTVVGLTVGVAVGCFVGTAVGVTVGFDVGNTVGTAVGLTVGVAAGVGSCLSLSSFFALQTNKTPKIHFLVY